MPVNIIYRTLVVMTAYLLHSSCHIVFLVEDKLSTFLFTSSLFAYIFTITPNLLFCVQGRWPFSKKEKMWELSFSKIAKKILYLRWSLLFLELTWKATFIFMTYYRCQLVKCRTLREEVEIAVSSAD